MRSRHGSSIPIGMPNLISQEVAVETASIKQPMPSMCPVTKCPPILLPIRNEVSRLTYLAARSRSPKVVLAKVSGEAVAIKPRS